MYHFNIELRVAEQRQLDLRAESGHIRLAEEEVAGALPVASIRSALRQP